MEMVLTETVGVMVVDVGGEGGGIQLVVMMA